MNPNISPVEEEARKKITSMLRKFDKVVRQNDQLSAYELYILWKMAKDSEDVFADLAIMAYKAGYVRGRGSRKKARV